MYFDSVLFAYFSFLEKKTTVSRYIFSDHHLVKMANGTPKLLPCVRGITCNILLLKIQNYGQSIYEDH